MLNKIKPDDLLANNNTYLTLDDYDWMNYTLKTKFNTKEHGTMQVEFSYFGTTISTMEVIMVKDDLREEYIYTYPTELFQKHIILFLTKHIGSWNSELSFNGENEVIEFFNDVIELGELEIAA